MGTSWSFVRFRTHDPGIKRAVGETDVEDNHFEMGVDDWDIIGQCAPSLMTVTTVVKQVEGDKYPTNSLVLSFMNSCMRSLSEDAPIKQTWLDTGNV